jgi:hypothetical protein
VTVFYRAEFVKRVEEPTFPLDSKLQELTTTVLTCIE